MRRPRRLNKFDPISLPLTDADHELIAAAHQTLTRHYRPFWHMVAAAVRSLDGRIWTGIHLGTTVGRMSVCAEPIALGRALLEGDGTLDTIVAVRHPKPEETDRELAVVSPCGACRELVLDHWPDAMIILKNRNGLIKIPAGSLLPAPYRR